MTPEETAKVEAQEAWNEKIDALKAELQSMVRCCELAGLVDGSSKSVCVVVVTTLDDAHDAVGSALDRLRS